MCVCVCVCVCVCMYKVVIEITKETWGKCGIKTLIYHNEEEKINELWHKMSNIETQLGHSNIADVVLKRIRKYCGKKKKNVITEEEEKIQSSFGRRRGCFYY